MKLKIVLFGLLSAGIATTYACTKITNNFGSQGVFTARTMDICVDLPYEIAVYPRGMQENGQTKNGKNLTWTSKYASIMVREKAGAINADADGVNEKGLAINLLYLDGSKYETRDLNKPGVLVLKWAKYVLDNYSNVKDVVNNLNHYQVTNEAVALGKNKVELPLHFSIEDTSGNNAVIEFINGKVTVYQGKQYNVMTNEPGYDQQLENLTQVQQGKLYTVENLPGGAEPKNRFVRAYFYSQNMPKTPLNKTDVISNMYSAISGEFVPYTEGYQKNCSLTGGGNSALDVWPTQWTTIIDQNQHVLYLIDGKTGNQVEVNLSKFNINQGQPVRTIDPQKLNFSHDVTGFFK